MYGQEEQLPPWGRVLEELIITHLFKKFQAFYGNRGSLLCWQQSATSLCPKPVHPAHIFPTYVPKNPSNIILPLMPKSCDW
jgi:hypothetical protein